MFIKGSNCLFKYKLVILVFSYLSRMNDENIFVFYMFFINVDIIVYNLYYELLFLNYNNCEEWNIDIIIKEKKVVC